MADVLPFAGTRFNTKEHSDLDLSRIIAPPFDVITEEQQKELHDGDPQNMVRLTAGFEAPGDDELNNRYSRAADLYRDLKARNVLVDEQRKCFYVYEHEFNHPVTGDRVVRRGFFALVKLQDYRSGKIRAHEMTYPEPKRDRVRLLKATQVNLEPLFILFNDENNEVANVLEESIAKGKPTEVVNTPDGEQHRLWMIHKKEPILTINQAMKPKRLYIADGHHRYEAALQYRDEMREITGRRDGRQPYDFILMYLNPVEDDSLVIGPNHRVLARDVGSDIDPDEVIEDLEEYFEVKEFKIDLKDLEKATAAINKQLAKPSKVTRFIMVLPGGRAFDLKLQKGVDYDEMIDHEFMSDFLKQQDVTILHKYVIARGWIGNPEVELDEEDIFYCRETSQALDLVRRRKGCVAFLMYPMSRERVIEVAENGELLPQNSTYFTPKIPSGFVLRDLQVGFG